jgi:hypothetical protein
MPPKDKKTPDKGEKKKRKTSPKEKATVIRDEPERNLFLECLQSTNQPPTARDLPAEPKRRSARNSHSTPSQSTPQQSTPSPSPVEDNPKKKKSNQRIQQSTRAPSPNGKAEHPSNLLAAGENTPTGMATRENSGAHSTRKLH